MPWVKLKDHDRNIPLTDRDIVDLACGRTVKFMSAELGPIFSGGRLIAVQVISGDPTKWQLNDFAKKML